MSEIHVYTDGGCHGNPGPGGWGFVAIIDGREYQLKGAEAATTNNRMELRAVIQALQFLRTNGYCDRATVHVHTDSQYVQKGMSDWMERWEANAWRTAGNKPVKNMELWKLLRRLAAECEVRWHWLRGHAGDRLNERCDALVQEAIEELETA